MSDLPGINDRWVMQPPHYEGETESPELITQPKKTQAIAEVSGIVRYNERSYPLRS